MEPEKKVKRLVDKKIIDVVRDSSGVYVCSFRIEGKWKTYILHSKEFEVAFARFWFKRYSEVLKSYQLKNLISLFEMIGFDEKLEYQVVKRVYNEDDNLIIYDLDQDKEVCVCIENGECSVESTPQNLFIRDANFKNQVMPDFNRIYEPKELLGYVRKHFFLDSEKAVKLLSMYLVACFTGMSINMPILWLEGEKGSSKSTTLRKLEMIVDPKQSGICTMPKSKDGLVLRLRNSYYTTFDNVSYISQSVSDALAAAVTKASSSDRELFESVTERISNTHSIIAINGIGKIIRASDLLDRTLLIKLSRIPSDQLKTERQMWEDFDRDLPRILGCLFTVLAQTLNYDIEFETQERVRMVDFHEFLIKVGYVLEISEEEVNELLFENKRELSIDAVHSNCAAICLIEMMKNHKSYEVTPTQCLHDLRKIAKEIGVDPYLLPKDATRLRTAIEKVKDELNKIYGITFKAGRGKERKYRFENIN